MRQLQNWPASAKNTRNHLEMYKAMLKKATSDTMQSNVERNRSFSKAKRFRSAFTTTQINYLEQQYQMFPYVDYERRKQLAEFLKLEERPIKIWFQNRRMKEKKENSQECDNDPNQQEIIQESFNNMPTASSTNDRNSYSLPILIMPADATTESFTNKGQKEKSASMQENIKKTVETEHISKPKCYKDAQNDEHISPYFRVPTSSHNIALPFTVNARKKTSSQRHTSAADTINLSKKNKEKSATNATTAKIALNDGSKEKCESSEPKKVVNHEKYNNCTTRAVEPSNLSSPDAPKQVNLNNPAYCPVMPTIYAPPFMTPEGVLWKPVNVMPLMAAQTPSVTFSGAQRQTSCEQSSNHCMCKCLCRTPPVPLTIPPNLQNPFAQYVITVPYQYASPNI